MARRSVESVITEIPETAISFDADAFDAVVRSQGVRLIHYTALRCPVGMTDLDDNRRPHNDHAGCSNGFLYQKSGCITALMIGNTNKMDLRDIGFVDGASATSTFPRSYDDCKPFYLAQFDRFYLDEEAIAVPTWQLIRANETGLERLQFPAEVVERLVDARGDEYKEGQDFVIKQGQVAWVLGGRRPINDLEVGRGSVCSIRYRYRPFWYCARLLHEIRVSQIDNSMVPDRKLVRMPQQALLNREFLFLNENDSVVDGRTPPKNTGGPSGAPRTFPTPEEGGFGPR